MELARLLGLVAYESSEVFGYALRMRAVVQRVREAQVEIGPETGDREVVGQIGRGLMVLLGVVDGDSAADRSYIASKLAGLRIFEDDEGKMNRSVSDVGGAVLLVSQFTLAGDARKGRRPSFVEAAAPEVAEPMYDALVEDLRNEGLDVQTGRFRTHMRVSLVNEGPVTILLDSRKTF